MSASDTLVGIVGLGGIGGAVAKHVLASGRPMIGWARRPDSLEGFVAHGGRAADSLAGLAAAEVVISVVFDDAAVREIAFGPAGLVEAMAPGTVHVAMQTVSPQLVRELDEAHRARGQRFLAAPVFGRPEAAARCELAIMCAGPEDVFRLAEPILSTAGKARWIGSKPEQAMAVKLGGNHMILGMGELLGEVFRFLRASGVSPADARTALTDDLLPQVLAGYAASLSANPDGPRPAASAIGRKDNALLVGAARDLGVDVALAHCLAGGY